VTEATARRIARGFNLFCRALAAAGLAMQLVLLTRGESHIGWLVMSLGALVLVCKPSFGDE
jgi:hypothetical protein